jgi:hypothetical protein
MNIRLGIIFFLIIYFCTVGNALTAMAGERILYRINPFGKSEFVDEGIVSVDGRDLRVCRFRTRIIGFDDNEKIYSDPLSGLPVRVERNIRWPFSSEYIVEEYDQQNFTMVMRKYKGTKMVEEHKLTQSGPIYSAILFPFSLRNVPGEPELGWRIKTAFPNEYEIKLISIDHVKVNAGEFEAFHFISEPHTFDIWISKDQYRIPVQIQGRGTFGRYTMKLHAYYPEGIEPVKK